MRPELYQDLLHRELEKRRLRNPAYSQAAFARDLRITPGRLCEIFKHKQGVSPALAEGIATRLGLANEARGYFVDLVRIQHARAKSEKAQAEKRILKYQAAKAYGKVESNTFKVISEWQHFAILELIKLNRFVNTPGWISEILAIPESSTNQSIHRLKTAGLLKVVAGKLVATNADNCFPGGVPSRFIKRFHTQLLRKALAALYTQPLETREFSTTLMAIDRKQLPALKRRINEFWKDLDQEMNQQPEKSDVYCLGIQLFNLTEGKKPNA